MLHIYNSRNLHRLAEARLKRLTKEEKKNVLAPEVFVVQNHGMARWMSLFLADREGIAANMQFKFPAELYWQILRVMNPGIPEQLPSERRPMTWAIFHLIQSDRDAVLSALHRYVHHPEPQKQEMRCWNLACRIADVFDQYLTYRPEMIRAWETRKGVTRDGSERWQAALWRKLVHYWQQDDQKKWNHRAVLQRTLLKAIDHQELPPGNIPESISIFGVTEMPPVYLKTFLKLSKCIDIHFYRVDVASNSNNSFIRSMGHAGHEFQSLIDTCLQSDDQISCKHINLDDGDDNIKAKNSFQIIKQDLLYAGQSSRSLSSDHSIQIHSCHSPQREVEVLYNQLLKMLDSDNSLQPADIQVLCPQMDVYAPAVEAIFGAVEEGLPVIPFHLAERSSTTNVVDMGFLKLLELAQSRFKVTDVLDLLECPPVRQAYSLSEEDVSTLEKWIGDTRIRWGIDGPHKASLDLPASDRFTWQSGLHRIILGYAMEGRENSLFEDIYPYGEIQQSEQARLVGQFSQLMHHLFDCHKQVTQSRQPQGWHVLLNSWLDLFFANEEPFIGPLQGLRRVIDTFDDHTRQASFDGTLSFGVLQACLQDMIAQNTTGGGRSGQGVTFSSLIPMRNIPAKVICMIGMNDGVFPRTKNTVEFDLISQKPQPGDRLPGRDDRQLFLECILAAGTHIYFSYVGQSNRKDVVFPPSVVLQEWIDYIADHYKIDSYKWIQQHRLHSFSPLYFKNYSSDQLFSYSAKNCNIARQLTAAPDVPTFFNEDLAEPDDTYRVISIEQLITFFQHPAKFLLRERLGIYMGSENIIDEDRESFELNALERYNMGQQMLERLMETAPLQEYEKMAFAKNELPDGWPGQYAFENQAKQVKEFSQRIESVLEQQKLAPLEVTCQSDDFQLSGQLSQIYDQYQLLYRFGRIRPKDLIELWIKHLMLQINTPEKYPRKSRIYGRDKYKPVVHIELAPVPEAKKIVDDLLQIYWCGLQQVTLFFPGTSYAYSEEIFNGEKEEQAMEAAQKKWINNNSDYGKEGDDPYNKRIINNLNPLEEKELKSTFKQISQSFWAPFFESWNKAKRGS